MPSDDKKTTPPKNAKTKMREAALRDNLLKRKQQSRARDQLDNNKKEND